jgi:hypothetical protein
MSVAADPVPLDRLTPATAAEVKRNLLLAAGILGAGAAVLAAVLLPFLPAAAAAAVLVAVAVYVGTLFAVSVAAGYLAGGWVGMMRTAFVARTWGIDPAALSNAALRRRTGERGYWVATLRGAAVGAGFVAALGLLYWVATGKVISGGGGWVMVLIGPMLISARTYAVRRAVAEKLAAQPAGVLP